MGVFSPRVRHRTERLVAMRPRDFLHKDAATPLNEHFVAAGAVCRFSTNSEPLLEAAHASFVAVTPTSAVDFSVRFWVDEGRSSQPPWPKPYVRGLDHLVFAGFDSGSSMLADLRTRRVIGRFSAAMAADPKHWSMVVFPMLTSIVAGTVGLVELHSSCVSIEGGGLLLMGPSRSGKSTLAKALSDAGCGWLSDDRVFCSLNEGKLRAWGLPRPLKLRREAGRWFDDYRDLEPTDVQNGERVFHCAPQRLEQQHVRECEPRLLVCLDRQERDEFALMPIERSEMQRRIEGELLAEDREAVRKQAEVIEHLLSLPCRILRYGGRPQVIAQRLVGAFLDGSDGGVTGGTA
jgi:hypothetical protein